MAEYIDRELTLAKMMLAYTLLQSDYLKKTIDAIPAADVAPVVHAHWVEYPECLKYPNAYNDDHIVCSACKECFSVLDNDTERFNYCPNCGAKMDEEDGDG